MRTYPQCQKRRRRNPRLRMKMRNLQTMKKTS
jgi:hypothetical protein